VTEGRTRAVIDAVLPCIDGGRFPLKRIVGEAVAVEAHCFTDGHDKLRVALAWRHDVTGSGGEVDMRPQANDVWLGEFTPSVPGRFRYTVTAWVDHFESWRRELERRDDPGDICVALQVGSTLVSAAAAHATGSDALILQDWSRQLNAAAGDKSMQHARPSSRATGTAA
jgi:starch synthase (maltosyl-transferring)